MPLISRKEAIKKYVEQDFKCGICDKPLEWKAGAVDRDHILRRRDGGTDDWDNIRLVHPRCNRKREMLSNGGELIDNEFARWASQNIRSALLKGREKGRSGWHDEEQCSNSILFEMALKHLERGESQYVDAAVLILMAAWRSAHHDKP